MTALHRSLWVADKSFLLHRYSRRFSGRVMQSVGYVYVCLCVCWDDDLIFDIDIYFAPGKGAKYCDQCIFAC